LLLFPLLPLSVVVVLELEVDGHEIELEGVVELLLVVPLLKHEPPPEAVC
jgi:hypothetical protein